VDASGGTPTLRCRERNIVRVCPAGAAIIGKAASTDGDLVAIEGARNRRCEIFVDDLAETIGDRDLALGLFLDAIAHRDEVRVGAERNRITYANAAQSERVRIMAEEVPS